MSECSVKHLKWGATWPSREQFHELADAGYRVIPIVRRLLADSLTPVGFYERLAGGRSAPSSSNRRNTAARGALQFYRRQLDGPAALQQRSGRLAGQGPGRRARHR